MRVLFTTYPSVAHLLPIVPLAWAFQSAGHEVRIASHYSITDNITAAGLTAVALGEPQSTEARNREDAPTPRDPELVLAYAEALGLNEEELEHWITFFQYMLIPAADYVRPDLPEAGDLIAFAQAWKPDLVLWDPTFSSAPFAARLSGAAHGRLLFGTDCFAWSLQRLAARREQVRAAGLPENPLADLLRPLAERHGVEIDDELLLGQWTVDPTPPGYGPPTTVTTIHVRHVPYSGAEPAQPWLLHEPQVPRVALSLGESNRRFIPGDWDRLPKLIEAVDGLGVEVVATLNALQLQGIEKLPDNVCAIEWVPLTQLLPTCSAIIHHGGVGTMAAARALRVPQISCDTGESLLLRQETAAPDAVDTGTYQVGREFGVAEAVEATAPRWIMPAKSTEATPVANYLSRTGAGVALNHRALSVEEIGKLILQVVELPRFRTGAAAIHESWLATPSPAEVVGTLVALVGNRRG
ncbi:nucleotide disphospho-sugar-binding domain-containing protein [Dactylosporangium sp. NPDC049140]|uniref:nucleotide disphospho-sugar-binding domain-containing protein n=1 Tax=unclassified Dactylosporangium TaxID=2621675 RepID=UPI0033EA0682